MEAIAIICTAILTFFYFKLYHTLFPTIIYFKNPISAVFYEIVGCGCVAIATVALVGPLILQVLGVIGGIMLFIIKAALTMAVTGGVAYVVYKIVDKLKKEGTEGNKSNWIAAVIAGILAFTITISILFGDEQSTTGTEENGLPDTTITSTSEGIEDNFATSEQTEDEKETDYISELEEDTTEESVKANEESKETYEETSIIQEGTSANSLYGSEIQEEDYVLPYGDVEDVSMMGDIVNTMEPQWLRVAKNEIFARHGRMFSDAGLQAYFDSKDWYHGYIKPEDFDMNTLTEIEKSNIDFLDELYKNATN